jgi:thioredoxin-related protein
MFRRSLLAILALSLGLGFAAPASATGEEPPRSDDGLYTQPWFKKTSFLDLAEDLAEAKAAGKRLAILWEQRGCPYCREMHRVNFAIPEVVSYIRDNFVVLQLNLWGDREVTDFDGDAMAEKRLARKQRVSFTPTIVFVGDDGGEVFRMPGYFKPFHFLGMFEYVRDEGYDKEPFQRWLQAKADRMREEGKEVIIWDKD